MPLASVGAPTPLELAPDGWPLVERKSALVDFLELCHAGAAIKSEILQADVRKREDGGCWTGYGEQDLTSRDLVLAFREELLKYDDGLDEAALDKMFINIDPVDKIRIKREVAAAASEDEDSDSEEKDTVQPKKIAAIDISGDGEGVETQTIDGGASSSSAKLLCHTPTHSLSSITRPLRLLRVTSWCGAAHGAGRLAPCSSGVGRLGSGRAQWVSSHCLVRWRLTSSDSTVHLTIQAPADCYAAYQLPLHLRLSGDSHSGNTKADALEDLLDAMDNGEISFAEAAASEANPNLAAGAEPNLEAAGALGAASPAPSLSESVVVDSSADEQVGML